MNVTIAVLCCGDDCTSRKFILFYFSLSQFHYGSCCWIKLK